MSLSQQGQDFEPRRSSWEEEQRTRKQAANSRGRVAHLRNSLAKETEESEKRASSPSETASSSSPSSLGRMGAPRIRTPCGGRGEELENLSQNIIMATGDGRGRRAGHAKQIPVPLTSAGQACGGRTMKGSPPDNANKGGHYRGGGRSWPCYSIRTATPTNHHSGD